MKDFWSGIEYFTPAEMRDPDGNIMDEHFMYMLDELRQRCMRPLIVTSAYRSPEYNKSIGGAKNSYHVVGKAVDIKISSIKEGIQIIRNWQRICCAWLQPAGIGMDWDPETKTGFVHVDIGPDREWDYD